jgi:hypothetical protein
MFSWIMEPGVPDTSLKQRMAIIAILCVAFLQGLYAIYQFGYNGQDWPRHVEKILEYRTTFTYMDTNPPGFYWLGHQVHRLVGDAYVVEATACVGLILNLIAVVLIWHQSLDQVKSWSLRFAALLLMVFVPFRAIHSVVISADAVTLPCFAAILICSLAFLNKVRESPLQARGRTAAFWFALLCLFWWLGTYSKYLFCLLGFSFVGMYYWAVKPRPALRWLALAVLCLLPTTLTFGYMMYESWRVETGRSNQHFRNSNDKSQAMTWRDLLLPKIRDRELLEAPYYWDEGVTTDHRYSYLGLLHMSMFSDTMGFWQDPPASISRELGHRTIDIPHHVVTPIKKRFNQAAIIGSLPITLWTLWVLLSFPRELWRKRTTTIEVLLFVLGVPMYCALVLSLPFVRFAYYYGYWLPRLVMPSLLCFFALAILRLHRVLSAWNVARKTRSKFEWLTLAYAILLSGIYLAAL